MDTALLKTLKEIFEQFPNFWNGETLQRSLVIDAIQKKEADVIKALINNKKIKTIYSTDVDGVLIFDFDKLISLLKYKEYWADSFTKYRNKVGLTSEGKYLDYSSDVVLDFPFKDCVLEGGMTKEDQGKDEVYYNEVIARDEIDRLFSPKVLTNSKRYTKDGIEENITEFKNDNLIIKGNNLIALHSLKDRYAGKVKLIYIDPPYNTGGDSFKYNDRFNHSTWLTFMKNRLEIARELLSEDGVIFVQCDDNEQAYLKVLLDNSFGIENNEVTIYVQVRFGNKTLNEDNDYQKLIEHIFVYSKSAKYKPNKNKIDYTFDAFCYEIVELSEGRKETIGGKEVIIFKPDEYEIKKVQPHERALKATWATGSLVNQGGSAAEFLHLFLKERKSIDGLGILYKVMDMGTKGDGLGYRYITGPKKESAVNGLFYTGIPLDKQHKDEKEKEIPINNLILDSDIYDENFWDFKDSFGNCRSQGGVKLNAGKKPEQLLKKIIEISTNEDDLVLDFHLGSGTTCAVAHKMKRRYIGIEQLDYQENSAWNRLNNVINGDSTGISKEVDWKGGGSFVYTELMELNYLFIHKIAQAEKLEDLLQLFDVMKAEAHLNYQIDLEKILNAEYEIDGIDHLVSFNDLGLAQQKQLLIELLDKNQLYVNASEMDDESLAISESDKEFTTSFYQGGQ